MAILPIHRQRQARHQQRQIGEKVILLIIFVAFAGVCFGAFLFVPDFGEKVREKGSSSVRQEESREGLQLQPPDHMHHGINVNSEGQVSEDKSLSTRDVRHMFDGDDFDKKTSEAPIITTQAPRDPETEYRQNFIKKMAKHAWAGYEKYAWGENELKPISKRGHSASVFGQTQMGATIVDSLDTLYIMGLMDEYKHAREWVVNSLNFNQASDVSVFEMTIRFVGGLLSTYALTKDEVFKIKAVDIARHLLPAFDTRSSLSYSLVNLETKAGKNWNWAPGRASILAEVGTMHLEFAYLTHITGDPIFYEKVEKVRDRLESLPRPSGLYYNYIHPASASWGQQHVSIGALGDSFYEYLLKSWIQTNGKDTRARKMYDDAMDAMEKEIILTSRDDKLVYFAEKKNQALQHKMDHLACFAAGMMALGSAGHPSKAERFMTLGKEVTKTCHESYDRTATKLGPESFYFSGGSEARGTVSRQRYYIQRPEVIESYFYLWRLTKDKKYREWGWEAAQAIEQHCRVENGYSGIKDVSQNPPVHDDVQQSFFMAETLKYLYLLFSDDDVIPLDKWVFNTEAHPLPVLDGIPQTTKDSNTRNY